MDALVNRQLLEQTTWDSGAPSGTAAVAHRFRSPGSYFATALLEDQVVGELELTVLERPGGAEAEGPPRSAEVDLGWVRRAMRERLHPGEGERSLVAQDGHVLFCNTGQATGYAVTVTRPEGQEAVFDTRQLGEDDLFSVTMVRPGRYSVTNTLTGAEGGVTVAYPTVGERPYRPPDPASVVCNAGGFEPPSVDLQPAQGLIFRFEVPSRIVITLVEPDDGPSPPRARTVTWRSPRPGPG
jgi:hypothetical protein